MDKEESLLIPWLRSPLLIGGIDCYGDSPELESEQKQKQEEEKGKGKEVELVVGNAPIADIASLPRQSDVKNTIESSRSDELLEVVKVVAYGTDIDIDCSDGTSRNPSAPGTYEMLSDFHNRHEMKASLSLLIYFYLLQVILLRQFRSREEEDS